MRRSIWWCFIPLVLLLAAACGGDDDECGADEVEVQSHGDDGDITRTECAAIPAECGATVDCDDDACHTALYLLCGLQPGGLVGGVCNDSQAPVIVGCYLDLTSVR